MRNNKKTDLQSIYRNALPIYKKQRDICTVDERGEEFAEEFIQSCFYQSRSIPVHATANSAKKLQHLYVETRNLARLQGHKTLGFGYPLFLLPTKDTLIVAPLFIKSLNLEPDSYDANLWQLHTYQNSNIEVNEWLIRFWKENFAFEEETYIRNLLSSGNLNPTSLKKLSDKLEQSIGLQQYGSSEAIIPAPAVDVIGAIPENGGLQWSAVLGIYPPQISQQNFSSEEYAEVIKPAVIKPAKDSHPFGMLPLHPQAATALHELRQQKSLVVEGRSNSGKTHLLTYLLSNILSNGEKCLVVADSAESLKKCQLRLSKTGFQRFHYLLKDTRHDRQNFLEILRSVANKSKEASDFSAAEFEVIKGQCMRLHQRLAAQYHCVKESVFGEENRTELTGRYLRSRLGNSSDELLNAHLNINDYEFQPEEYKTLKRGILISHVLFDKINTFKHPLNNLHPYIFTEQDQEQGKAHVEQRCQYFLAKTEQLNRLFNQKINTYKSRLKEYYDLHYREFTYRLRSLRELISDNERRYGSPFLKSSKSTLKLKGVFFNKEKQILRVRQQIESDFISLEKAFEEKKYFDFEFVKDQSGLIIEQVLNDLNRFELALNAWRDELPQILLEEINRLSSKNVNPKLKQQETLINLEQAQEELLKEINAAQLYAAPLEHKMLTLTMRRKFTERVAEQLEDTLRNLRDFNIFYKWQRNWLLQTPQTQNVVKALAKVKPTDWTSCFEAWYFRQAMTHYADKNMPNDEDDLFAFAEAHEHFQSLLPQQIEALQEEIQEQSIKNLRRKHRKTYNLLFNKNNSIQSHLLPFSEIVEQGIDTITDIFPILFTGLQAAKDLTKNRENYFDYILLIESDNLNAEDTAGILQAGKRTAVFTDPYFENKWSLSDFYKINAAPTVHLNRLETKDHQKMAPFTISQTELIKVEGRFKEKSEVNEAEVQTIIQVINSIDFAADRTLPSVGIITFTKSQRDAVAAFLLQQKQKNTDNAEKIRQLERNGMGVFFIEEVIGQHFDVLVVSMTFGTISTNGRVGKKIKYLESTAGLQGVKYILSKTTQKIHLIYSLSDELLEDYIDRQDDTGGNLLGHLIAFSKSVKNRDLRQARYHYDILWVEEEKEKQKSLFRQEARRVLQTFFPAGRVLQRFQHNETTIPLAITPLDEGSPAFWLQADIFLANTPQTDFIWEIQERKKIEADNIKFQSVYSLKWSQNANLAAGKLAAKIIKSDRKEI